MTVVHKKTGKQLQLPWNNDFDAFLGRMSELTYLYDGDELLHEIHKETIEAKYMVIRFYSRLRQMLAACLVLLSAIIALMVFR